jgi:catalase
MNGYSSHTYMWINAGGERFWVKYHFKTDQGVEFLTPEAAAGIAANDPDAHIRDLSETIARGDHPSWSLFVQVMPFADATGYRFNPFDLTKVWPHSDYPLVRVGRMVLDRNPENYFAEIEQSTFEPSNLVPGIGPSPDKMLLARLFSYHDTHLHRVGPNAQHLPVNRPRSPVHSYNRDGFMRTENPPDPVYAPNSYGGPVAEPERFGADPSWAVAGEFVRTAYELHREDDDFGQAGTMVRDVLDDAARDRLVGNVVGHVRAGVVEPVLTRVKEYWRQVDPGLGARIAKELEA